MPPRITISPPLLNSASPWATTTADLRSLHDSPYTGAVTTRTCLLSGFPHNPHVHQHAFAPSSSLNTYGYSPYPLSYYLTSIASLAPLRKPFIVSITGTPADLPRAISEIAAAGEGKLYIEINLSCPNIPGAPPPAYDPVALREYLDAVPPDPGVPVGIKTPPYTHAAQYDALFSVLTSPDLRTRIAFITATNTLGGCLLLDAVPSLSADQSRTVYQPTLSSADATGIGGMGGDAIHPLALGNVCTIRKRLDDEGLRDVVVIGVGGVGDQEGMKRMVSVGAAAVGVATAFGRGGVGIFGRILRGEEEEGVGEGVMDVSLPPD